MFNALQSANVDSNYICFLLNNNHTNIYLFKIKVNKKNKKPVRKEIIKF